MRKYVLWHNNLHTLESSEAHFFLLLGSRESNTWLLFQNFSVTVVLNSMELGARLKWARLEDWNCIWIVSTCLEKIISRVGFLRDQIHWLCFWVVWKQNCSHQVNIGSHGRTLSFFLFLLLLFMGLFWGQVGVNLLFLPLFVPHANSPPNVSTCLLASRFTR